MDLAEKNDHYTDGLSPLGSWVPWGGCGVDIWLGG